MNLEKKKKKKSYTHSDSMDMAFLKNVLSS
jgi:hypothetical protein